MPVWHASASKVAGIGNEQKGKGMARNAVGKMLANFPPLERAGLIARDQAISAAAMYANNAISATALNRR